MCRGYHRRQLAQWEHTREHITALFNIHRDPKTPALKASEVMPLPTDGHSLVATTEPEEDIEALWAELDQRDAALLHPKNG
jgi:hypothetical protein